MSLVSFVRGRVWTRTDPWARCLVVGLRPLSWLFRAGVGARSVVYGTGLVSPRKAPIAVVSVGNLSVGGTGKTPLTLWLARRLCGRGSRAAIVSRGYGGSSGDVTVVSGGDGPIVDAAVVGDEPVMMARSFDGVVVTARRRIDGVRRAAELGCDVAVLDDGFQHRRLARDFDIVIYDGLRGPLLPAGPMRESPRALRRADAVVLTSAAGDLPRSIGRDVPTFRMTTELTGLVESVGGEWQARSLACLAGKRVVAVVGIAHPERFYDSIHRWDATIEEVFEYPDHHPYTRADWQKVSRRSQDCDLLVTTEKDLVKLQAFPFARGKLMALRVEPSLDDEERMLALIEERIAVAD